MRAILILGAAVWADGPSPTLRRRTLYAAALWQADPAQLIMPCGGLGRYPPSEASAMKTLLCAAGVPPSQIILEDQSATTFENIANAVDILTTLGVQNVTIVTDSYHKPRAWMVARAFGLRAQVATPPLRGTNFKTQAKQLLREAGAIPAYTLKLAHHLWQNRR